jgi:hypothetical protein
MKHKLYTFNNLWLRKTLATGLLLMAVIFHAHAQTQLVKWDFSGFTNTPTSSIAQNNGKLVTAVGQNQAAFVSAVGTTYDPPYICNGWNVPANTAYFLINFSTLNFDNINITYFLGAFQFGAKSFQPQYSVVSNTGPWLDFGTAVTFQPAGGDFLFTNVPLPADADNQPNVWVRLLSTTTTINTGGDYIDEIEVMGSPMVPLSVNISDFTVLNKNEQNILNWSTATETNNSHFELQMSDDATTYRTLATIQSQAAAGNSYEALYYSYTDQPVKAGHHFYRLKQTDKDGRAVYSKVIDIVNTYTDAAVKIYPNPVIDVLNVEIAAHEDFDMSLTLTDVQGRLVKKSVSRLTSGINQLSTDMRALLPGVYTIQLYQDDLLIYTQKITNQ